jgi:adenosine deaminase
MTFAEALRGGSLESIRAFPKADRHCHSMLGARLRRIEQWVGQPLPEPPRRMASFDEMRAYLHAALNPHIRNRAGFEATSGFAVEDAIEDGVVLLEMSLDVDLVNTYDGGPDGYLEFVRALLRRFQHRIALRPEVGVSKNRPPDSQLPLALACIDSGLFGSIDLYGNEDARPPEDYRRLYRRARRRGLKLKAHVGEFGDAALVERTVRVLDLDEVQHGVAAAARESTMRMLARARIRLNVCPSSNVALSVAPDLGRHPLRALLDHGVRVSINSDDLTIFGRSPSEEYLALLRSGAFSAEELDRVRTDSLAD